MNSAGSPGEVTSTGTIVAMGFPHNYLHEGEELVLDLKPHWWTFAQPAAYAVGALVVMIVLFLPDVALLKWLGVLVLLVALGNLAVEYGQWATTHFVLSSERLIFRSGVLTKSGVEIPLDRVLLGQVPGLHARIQIELTAVAENRRWV